MAFKLNIHISMDMVVLLVYCVVILQAHFDVLLLQCEVISLEMNEVRPLTQICKKTALGLLSGLPD